MDKFEELEKYIAQLEKEAEDGRKALACMAYHGVQQEEQTLHIPLEDLESFNLEDYVAWIGIDEENQSVFIKVEKKGEETNEQKEKEE